MRHQAPAARQTTSEPAERKPASGVPDLAGTKRLTPDERRKILDDLMAHIRTLPPREGECAARSQDFLYDEDGLPG